jgi:hypothetical protein
VIENKEDKKKNGRNGKEEICSLLSFFHSEKLKSKFPEYNDPLFK